jgi:hypothetical protein
MVAAPVRHGTSGEAEKITAIVGTAGGTENPEPGTQDNDNRELKT